MTKNTASALLYLFHVCGFKRINSVQKNVILTLKNCFGLKVAILSLFNWQFFPLSQIFATLSVENSFICSQF
jgi:hypothetical protein